ncbi:MAG: hypothetical protein GY727_02170 [Gammaproteobacteria bacterium]|nr:hypothetical protein [Gammaproteobacteria bacterium]MCP4088867.1 hypothetical protein [Gammaproteobacteria bacterium]MCP4274883.1 hypothetical protein [Gammaproteobacteria bacterium]MCP4832050.1 hypothetical protein [Gammaproteobacteria bacterium]MCP4928349.1 hypothetical protein [Gammaproteobacteria bacterium]
MSNLTHNKTLQKFQLLGMVLTICALILSVVVGVFWLVSPELKFIEMGLMLSAFLGVFGFVILGSRVIFGYKGDPE